MDSAFAIAGGSLFLYVAASFYLSGYLRSFGCDADWFDPSIFQLITFSKVGISLAVVLAAGIWLLFEMLPFSGRWWGCYAVWLLLLLAVILLGTIAPTAERVPTAARWVSVGNNLVMVLAPLVIAFIARWHMRPTASATPEPAEACPSFSPAQDQKAIDITDHPEGRSAEDFRWAAAYSARRAANLDQRIAENDKKIAELAATRRFTVVFMAATTLYLAMHFSSMCGVAFAGMRFDSRRGGVSENAPDMRTQILFTDGVRTLSRNLSEGSDSIVYENPEVDLRLVVGEAANRVLTQPQTRPTMPPAR